MVPPKSCRWVRRSYLSLFCASHYLSPLQRRVGYYVQQRLQQRISTVNQLCSIFTFRVLRLHLGIDNHSHILHDNTCEQTSTSVNRSFPIVPFRGHINDICSVPTLLGTLPSFSYRSLLSCSYAKNKLATMSLSHDARSALELHNQGSPLPSTLSSSFN